MSFLSRVKSFLKINNDKNATFYKMDQTAFSEIIMKIANDISHSDKIVTEKAELILNDPEQYILDTYREYQPIDFEIAFKGDIQDKQWWLIHDVLTQQDYIHYLDWKDDAGIFIPELDTLKGREIIPAVIKEKDFNAEDDLTAIFTYVNGILDKYDYVLCVYDIEADGYPMFLTKKSDLEVLSDLAEKIGHRIGRAEIF